MALLCVTGRGEALKKRLFEDLRKNIAPDRALIVLVPELYTLPCRCSPPPGSFPGYFRPAARRSWSGSTSGAGSC